MFCSDEELILFATSIAMELSKNLTIEELEDLNILINQISCSINTLIHKKYTKNTKK